MQRNKLIYALADAALVVNSDFEKGGTWAGAIEQLERLHLIQARTLPRGDPSGPADLNDRIPGPIHRSVHCAQIVQGSGTTTQITKFSGRHVAWVSMGRVA
jgi:hypothetical protein